MRLIGFRYDTSNYVAGECRLRRGKRWPYSTTTRLTEEPFVRFTSCVDAIARREPERDDGGLPATLAFETIFEKLIEFIDVSILEGENP